MKSTRQWPVAAVLLAAFSVLTLSCGAVRQAAQKAAQEKQKQNDLMQIGIAYLNYCELKEKPPASADELVAAQPEMSALMQKVKAGEYVIIWGVDLRKPEPFEPQGKSSTILGYEASAPTSGGAVLMADTFTMQMTAAEFKSKTQAKSAPAKPGKN